MLSRLLAPAALLALAVVGCHRGEDEAEEKARPVELSCVAVTAGDLDEALRVRGRIAAPPGLELPLASQVPGRVNDVKVHEGDRIAKGAVVASVDDLAPRAAVGEADAAVLRAKASVANAEAALARSKDLASRGIASQKDVEDATAKSDAARADLEAARAAMHAATGTLGRTEIRSTFAGVVTKVWRGPGGLVDGTSATPIVQIAALDAVELVVDLAERDLLRVREGQHATIELLGGAALEGSVVGRARALDPATGLGSVRIALTLPDGGAAPALGTSARAVLALGHRSGVLAVPRSAFPGALADGARLAICKGDKAELRAVEIGYRDETRVEVTKGLAAGEEVAIDHVLGLEEGTPIARATPSGGKPAPAPAPAPTGTR